MSRPRRADPLRLDVLDVLLAVHRSVAEIEQLRRDGVAYDGFVEFDFDAAEIAALRLLHRDVLRSEAQRRGLPSDYVDALCADDVRSLRVLSSRETVQ